MGRSGWYRRRSDIQTCWHAEGPWQAGEMGWQELHKCKVLQLGGTASGTSTGPVLGSVWEMWTKRREPSKEPWKLLRDWNTLIMRKGREKGLGRKAYTHIYIYIWNIYNLKGRYKNGGSRLCSEVPSDRTTRGNGCKLKHRHFPLTTKKHIFGDIQKTFKHRPGHWTLGGPAWTREPDQMTSRGPFQSQTFATLWNLQLKITLQCNRKVKGLL